MARTISSASPLSTSVSSTDEDKAYGIDHWGGLFKSTTWEEVKMISENNPVLQEASEIQLLRVKLAEYGASGDGH